MIDWNDLLSLADLADLVRAFPATYSLCNLFAMSVNLLCPAAAWQGIILSALFCIV